GDEVGTQHTVPELVQHLVGGPPTAQVPPPMVFSIQFTCTFVTDKLQGFFNRIRIVSVVDAANIGQSHVNRWTNRLGTCTLTDFFDVIERFFTPAQRVECFCRTQINLSSAEHNPMLLTPVYLHLTGRHIGIDVFADKRRTEVVVFTPLVIEISVCTGDIIGYTIDFRSPTPTA